MSGRGTRMNTIKWVTTHYIYSYARANEIHIMPWKRAYVTHDKYIYFYKYIYIYNFFIILDN